MTPNVSRGSSQSTLLMCFPPFVSPPPPTRTFTPSHPQTRRSGPTLWESSCSLLKCRTPERKGVSSPAGLPAHKEVGLKVRSEPLLGMPVKGEDESRRSHRSSRAPRYVRRPVLAKSGGRRGPGRVCGRGREGVGERLVPVCPR